MIYFIGFICGLLNGVFASGAGQILIFYLVFIKKVDSYLGRVISILILTFTSIITLINYLNFIKVDLKLIFIIIPISIIFGFLGNKIMYRMDKNILNLISGLVLIMLSIYGVIRCYI